MDQKLKADVNKLERSSQIEISLESDIAHNPNEEITIIDEDPKVQSATLKINPQNVPISPLNQSSSSKVSPSTSPTKPLTNNTKGDRARAITDFKTAKEENKKEQDAKTDNKINENTMVSDEELKLDDVVNFQSFEIIKLLGSGAFGKVYKV